MKLLSALEKRKFLLFLITLFSLLALIFILSQIGERQLIEKRAAGENASLTLPSSSSAYLNQEFSVPIFINTDGVGISGVDVLLDFSADLGKIELVDIFPDAQTTTSLNVFLPIDSFGNFDEARVINQANTTGKIEFGAVSFNPGGDPPSTPFNGVLGPGSPYSPQFATLIFKVMGVVTPPQQATITVVHNPGVTTDSNLVSFETATDILAFANSLTLTIPISPTPTPSSTPTPTPTNTPTPTPTPTNTPTPTPTPTPTNTPTPSPTPTPIPPSLTFKVKFQGINQKGPDRTVKITFQKAGQVPEVFENVSVSSNNSGIYSGSIINITPDTYDIYIKGWSHLTRKFAAISLVAGENSQDFSSVSLLAGDADGSDRVDSLDFTILVAHYMGNPNAPSDSPADFDLNGRVDSLDFTLLATNYYQTGEK